MAGAALVVGALGFALGRPSGGPDPAAAVVSPAPTRGASPAPASHASASAVASAPATTPFASSSPVPTATPANTAEAIGPQLQATLDRLRIKTAMPGVSATILFADGSSWTGVSGLADVTAGKAVAPNTAFAIGSISKTFLATLIVELAAEGRIGLEDAAWLYLPGVKLDHAITIRQLLDHTSGLYDFFFHPKIDAALRANRAATWTAAQTLAYVGKPYFKPGLGWHYSNTNYLLLGLIAERVGRASLADQFRARFFGPLGLSTAFYQVDERARGPLAHGYRFAGSKRTLPPIDLADGTGVAPFRSVVTAAGGAGSVAASSIDLARWAKALYGGAVLSPDSLAAMLGDVTNTAVYKPRVPYGLGVQSVTVGGWPAVGHSGRLLGFQGVMRYFPGQGFAVAVLTNQSRADPGVILRGLVAIVAPPPPPPAPSASASPVPSALPSRPPSPRP